MRVDQRLDLFARIAEIEAGVLVAFLRHLQDVAEALGRHAERLGRLVRQDDVHAHQELLQIDLEVRPPLLVLQRLHRRVGHGGIGVQPQQVAGDEFADLPDTRFAEMLQQALVAFLQHRQLRTDGLQAIVQFLQFVAGGVEAQGLGQMVRQADVVHHIAALLAAHDPVGAGDGLQQRVLAQLLVDVHHLLDRRIEAGQQHVADDQKGNAGVVLVRVLQVERLAEVGDGIQPLCLLARMADVGRFVGAVRRNHYHGLEKLQPADQFGIRLFAQAFRGDPLG